MAILMAQRSKLILARALAVMLLLFVCIIVHILLGGAWEARTLGEMVLRLGFWIAAALLVWPRPTAPRT